MRIVIYITEKLHHYCIFYVFFHFMCFYPIIRGLKGFARRSQGYTRRCVRYESPPCRDEEPFLPSLRAYPKHLAGTRKTP